MKNLIFTIVAGSTLWLNSQNLQDNTIFHAAIHSSYSDVGPAYLAASSQGSPVLTTDSRGNVSQAVQFDGTDDYIQYPVNSMYQKKLPLSFSVWVTIDQLSGNFPVFTTDNSTAAYAGIVVQIANGIVFIGYGDGVGYGAENRSSIQSSTPLIPGTWYHIAGVVRGYKDMDLYINGVKDISATYSGASGIMSMAYDGASLSIGMYASKSGGSHQFFKGKIDDLQIWDREISEFEVFAKKNVLLSYSVVSGGTLENDGPFGLELENIGFQYGKDRFNRTGQAMQFNGSSNFGRIPSSATYRVQYPQTISAWVKINSQKAFHPIYASSDHVNSKYSGILLYLDNGRPSIISGDNQGAGSQFRRSFVSGDSLKVGQWYHVIAVCTALGSTTMYVNGVEVTNGSNSGTGSSMAHGTGFGFVGYLSEPNGGAARYFDGSIDEVMVLSATLTSAQVVSAFKPGVYFSIEPNDTTLTMGAKVLLKSKAEGSLPVAYQWYHRVNGVWQKMNTNKSSDLNIAAVAATDTGLYRCIATITGYADTSRSARISIIPTNQINEYSWPNVQVVPNPASSQIRILHLLETAHLTLVDNRGVVCLEAKVQHNTVLSLAQLSPGFYTICLTDGMRIYKGRLVKM